jgi:AraC-like DNA-binding protein
MASTALSGKGLEKLAEAADYKVSKMAALCGLSTRQLQRDFRRHLGCSPQAWLSEQRMQAARERLLAGEPVKVVALDLGFRHVPNFCEWFKTVNGTTAKEFVLSQPHTNGLSQKHNQWREVVIGVR